MHPRRWILLATLTAAVGGCTPRQSEDGDTAAQPVGTAPITVDEIANAGLLGSTTYDVVQRLRPTFLIDRTAIRRSSQPIMVSINGGELSSTSVLYSTPASAVQEIRYLTYGQASA